MWPRGEHLLICWYKFYATTIIFCAWKKSKPNSFRGHTFWYCNNMIWRFHQGYLDGHRFYSALFWWLFCFFCGASQLLILLISFSDIISFQFPFLLGPSNTLPPRRIWPSRSSIWRSPIWWIYCSECILRRFWFMWSYRWYPQGISHQIKGQKRSNGTMAISVHSNGGPWWMFLCSKST